MLKPAPRLALVLLCLSPAGLALAKEGRRPVVVELYRPTDGRIARFPVICRIDTPTELEYFKNGGVLPYVLRNLARVQEAAE